MTSDELELCVRMGAPITTRVRRGKLVAIPDKWVGQTTSQQTIRKRQSKHSRKMRMRRSWFCKDDCPRRERSDRKSVV